MDIAMLEAAADALMAPPSVVTAEDRRTAENIFQELKRCLTVETVSQIIQGTSNQFVLFQVGQSVGELILRTWPLLQQDQIEGTYRYLIEYVAGNESLQSFVVSEFLKSVAMILKRGILDGKTGDQAALFQMIQRLLTNNESTRLQAIGCQLISSITEQFSSSWRNSQFSITWDFHVKAKAEFEKTGLRQLLEMSLDTLNSLCEHTDILNNEFAKRLCDKFLDVADSIFSWNFAPRVFKRMFASNQSTNSFRPPEAWKDLMDNNQFLPLFFQLHSRIRSDQHLSVRSLSCLIQLAGLTGECMSDTQFGNRFVQQFVTNLLELFPEGPMEHEVNNFCTIIHRLFVFRPIQSLMRLPADLRSRFILYLTSYMQHLTGPAMTAAIGECRHDDHTSLALLYDSWVILLRGRGRWITELSPLEQQTIENDLMVTPTLSIVNSFIMAVQSPPFGTRPVSSGDEGVEDDDDEDDRSLFSDLFAPLGCMMAYNVSSFMDSMIQILRERLNEVTGFINGTVDLSRLSSWQEDMHWLLLVLSHSVVSEEMDGTCCVSGEVYDNSSEFCQRRGAVFNEDVKQQFLIGCLENPTNDRSHNNEDVDPFMRLLGELLAWSSMEHKLLGSEYAHLVSPEVTRSTLLCMKRFINAASHNAEMGGEIDPMTLPVLHNQGPFNEIIVQFSLKKVFLVLQRFSGEAKVCADAVGLLTGLIDSRAAVLAAAPELFVCLADIDIARLPSREALMKALVEIAAGANNTELQTNMYHHILAPLREKFDMLSQQPATSESDSNIVDLLQCFDGVAQAGQSGSAPTLAKFLHPLLSKCVPLMTSRALSPSVITAILHLLLNVTTRVSIYVEDAEDSNLLHQTLIQTVNCYQTEQKGRFTNLTQDDDDRAADLVIFMDILSNVLSKDLLEGGEGDVATGAQVAMMALEMLLSIMNENVLQIPDVAIRFYRLIVYLVQFSPEALGTMSQDLFNSICECLRRGLSSQFGTEVCALSMEGVTEVATYLCSHRQLQTPTTTEQILTFLPTAFESCLEFSCENSLFTDATAMLYALICFDKGQYEAFVTRLLSSQVNQQTVGKLRDAFNAVLPETFIPNRRAKIDFRKRMEKFLTEIQGLLTTN